MRISSVVGTMLLALISTSRSSEFDVIFPEKGCPELKQQRSRAQIRPLSAPQLKGIGESCKNTAECQPELCCLQQDHIDTCQKLPAFGDSCTPYQIKGGVYYENGPCLNGGDYCIDGMCVA
uniref:Ixodegrin B n=1 Tax=Rhipicephalus zambeziensis TaxID=60191 RepID=A0A224YB28_9ACAR